MIYLCTIKQDTAGKQFIEMLREQMKDCGKSIRLRGRGHRHGITRYRQSLPLPKASHVAVYTSL